VLATRSELLDKLQLTIQGVSAEKRIETLRRMTDLFLGGADRFSDEQIGVFNDVLVHLINQIEAKALIELSAHLAADYNAPIEAMQRLARNDVMAIAGPGSGRSRPTYDRRSRRDSEDQGAGAPAGNFGQSAQGILRFGRSGKPACDRLRGNPLFWWFNFVSGSMFSFGRGLRGLNHVLGKTGCQSRVV